MLSALKNVRTLQSIGITGVVKNLCIKTFFFFHYFFDYRIVDKKKTTSERVTTFFLLNFFISPFDLK